MLEEQVKILKLENEKLQEKRKAHLNVIERLTENHNSDFKKKQGMTGQQYAPTRTAKV